MEFYSAVLNIEGCESVVNRYLRPTQGLFTEVRFNIISRRRSWSRHLCTGQVLCPTFQPLHTIISSFINIAIIAQNT